MTEKNKSINQIIDFRKEKLNKLKGLGINPYPHKFSPTHKSIEILDGFSNLENKTVCVAGRIMALRKMGKASFTHVMDDKGRIQIFIKKDNVGENIYDAFNLMDIGDFIGINGSRKWWELNRVLSSSENGNKEITHVTLDMMGRELSDSENEEFWKEVTFMDRMMWSNGAKTREMINQVNLKLVMYRFK